MKTILYAISLALIAGCTASLGPVGIINEKEIILKDQREESDKKSFRESALTPLSLLGDENFDRNPMLYVQDSLQNHKPASTAKLELVVKKFRVMDSFPKRQGTAISGALFGVMSSLGYSTYISNVPTTEDSIICVLAGSLNDRPVNAVINIPYKAGEGVIRSDANWLAAVRKSIDDCVTTAISQAIP